MANLLKLLVSGLAFVWAVYPTEVGESDEIIDEYQNTSDSVHDNEDNYGVGLLGIENHFDDSVVIITLR